MKDPGQSQSITRCRLQPRELVRQVTGLRNCSRRTSSLAWRNSFRSVSAAIRSAPAADRSAPAADHSVSAAVRSAPADVRSVSAAVRSAPAAVRSVSAAVRSVFVASISWKLNSLSKNDQNETAWGDIRRESHQNQV